MKYGMSGMLRAGNDKDVDVVSGHGDVGRLAALSPEGRDDYRRMMRTGLVARYQPLTVVRDEQVSEVMHGLEFLAKCQKGTRDYKYFEKLLAERLEALVKTHGDVVKYVPILETEAGTMLHDTRKGAWDFHSGLRRYVSSLLPSDDAEMTKRLEVVLVQIDGMVEDSFLAGFDPNTEEETSKYHLFSNEANLIEGLQAFDAGEFETCQACFKELTETLDLPLHFQAIARVKLAELEFGTLKERLGHVRRAVAIFEKLTIDDVEEHMRDPVMGFADTGVELIEILEDREMVEFAKGVTIAG